jgi:hypothetical protein
MALWRETGLVAPRPTEGKRHGNLDVAEAFLLAAVARNPDIPMPELAAFLREEKAIAAAPPARGETGQGRSEGPSGGAHRRKRKRFPSFDYLRVFVA